jgi:hypothetical protein
MKGLLNRQTASWFLLFVRMVVVLFFAALGVHYCLGRSRRLDADATAMVQEIRVWNARAIELWSETDNEPILCFDIGDNRVLYLAGQWLLDASTYGEERQESKDPLVDQPLTINGLMGQKAFPNTDFTVVRDVERGDVLAIRCAGEWLPQDCDRHDGMELEYEFESSELFEGRLDDISHVLATAHRKRRIAKRKRQ